LAWAHAITDNLVRQSQPEIMSQLVFAIEHRRRLPGLDYRRLGRLALQNQWTAILPTPAIGGVGLLTDLSKMTTLAFKVDGEAILLLGGHGSHLGQSIYLREVLGREEGAPPPVDLAKEKLHGDFVRNLINHGQVTAVHDISDGGLAATVIEMALASGLGAKLDAMNHEALFGEDQALMFSPASQRSRKIITQAHVKGIDVIP
jgi:phosphoribosylformylglycinamidine synthase